MRRIATCFLSGLLIFCLAGTDLSGQATAEISGNVTDATGARIPGADISATQTDIGLTRNVVSNETGFFTIPALPLGPYRVEASLPGFQTYVETGIGLAVGSNPVINIVLQVGQVTETIEVQAQAALVETRAVGISQVMESDLIVELPLNGRNAMELVELQGGAVFTSSGRGGMHFHGQPGVSLAGGMGFGAQYTLDGASHNDPNSGFARPFPFPDALQEFNVETSGLNARSGGQGSGMINSVTKSGTNEIHGNGFWFLRDDALNAKPYGALENETLSRHQFGGTIGGPIVGDQVFFFAGYQGTELSTDPANAESFIPTSAVLAGDWSAMAACNGVDRLPAALGFDANNQIDPARYSVPAVNLASRLPYHLGPDDCGMVQYGIPEERHQKQFVGRIDYQVTDDDLIFGRYMITKDRPEVAFNLVEPVNNLLYQRGYDNTAHALTLGWNRLIGSSMVNSFRAGASKTDVFRKGPSQFSAPDMGINMYSYLPDSIDVSVTGFFQVGSATHVTSFFKNATLQVADDLSFITGNHQLSFGGEVARYVQNGQSNVRSRGGFDFNDERSEQAAGPGEEGLALVDFMLGMPDDFVQAGPIENQIHRYYIALYAADTWTARPGLTLNYGVRWEPYLPPEVEHRQIYNFSVDRFSQGIRSTVFPQADAGLYYPGDDGFPGSEGAGYSGHYNQWGNFGPRIGFAWDLTGDGRTSLRSSYALAYTFQTFQSQIDGPVAPPWGNEIEIDHPISTHGRDGFTDPWDKVPGGNPHPLIFNANDALFIPFGTYIANPYDAPSTYTQSWNMALQRQLTGDWMVGATYTGSATRHAWTARALNPGIYIPGAGDANGNCFLDGNAVWYTVNSGRSCSTNGNLEERRLLRLHDPTNTLGPVDEFDPGGTINYHGLILNARGRTSNGITLNVNYTWSHCVGDYVDFNGGGFDAGQGHPHHNDRSADRGNCPSDRRQVLNVLGSFDTPDFHNDAVRWAFSDWTFSSIYRISAGGPINIDTNRDQARTGNGAQRPNLVASVDPYLDKSGRPNTQWFNPAAFELAPAGTFGNLGYNALKGPKMWDFDIALARTFTTSETTEVQFRAEAFNVLNSFRPSNPENTITSGNFRRGLRSSRAQDMRILQFALKYFF